VGCPQQRWSPRAYWRRGVDLNARVAQTINAGRQDRGMRRMPRDGRTHRGALDAEREHLSRCEYRFCQPVGFHSRRAEDLCVSSAGRRRRDIVFQLLQRITYRCHLRPQAQRCTFAWEILSSPVKNTIHCYWARDVYLVDQRTVGRLLFQARCRSAAARGWRSARFARSWRARDDPLRRRPIRSQCRASSAPTSTGS
jgi:hypothetical protein